MIRSIHATLRSFRRDRRGVSAVEFALLSPFMVALYLGTVDISDAIGVDRKLTLTAGAIANLAAQTSSITATDMTDLLKAGTSVMAPYPVAPLKITISCLKIDDKKVAKVKWSETKGGTKRGTNTVVTLDEALAIPNTQLLFSEVSYDFTSFFIHSVVGDVTLKDKMYMSPRMSAPTYGTVACT